MKVGVGHARIFGHGWQRIGINWDKDSYLVEWLRGSATIRIFYCCPSVLNSSARSLARMEVQNFTITSGSPTIRPQRAARAVKHLLTQVKAMII